MLKSRKEYYDKVLGGKKIRAIKNVYYSETGLSAEQKKKHADAEKAFDAETKKTADKKAK